MSSVQYVLKTTVFEMSKDKPTGRDKKKGSNGNGGGDNGTSNGGSGNDTGNGGIKTEPLERAGGERGEEEVKEEVGGATEELPVNEQAEDAAACDVKPPDCEFLWNFVQTLVMVQN